MDSQLWQRFDDQLRIKLQKKMETRAENEEPEMANNGEVTDTWVQRRYTELTGCVQATIAEVVPDKKKIKRNGRTISAETKELFEKRKREFGKSKLRSTRNYKITIKNKSFINYFFAIII